MHTVQEVFEQAEEFTMKLTMLELTMLEQTIDIEIARRKEAQRLIGDMIVRSSPDEIATAQMRAHVERQLPWSITEAHPTPDGTIIIYAPRIDREFRVKAECWQRVGTTDEPKALSSLMEVGWDELSLSSVLNDEEIKTMLDISDRQWHEWN